MRKIIGKELQSNTATELQVFRLINNAHAPTPDLAEDAVMGNCLPHELGRSSHWREWYGEAGLRSISQPSVGSVLFENDRPMFVGIRRLHNEAVVIK